jgi:hypothetical protein
MLAEIMQQPWPAPSKKGFWDLSPGKNPPKFLSLKPNPLVDAMIAQVSLKKKFFRNFGILLLSLWIPHCDGVEGPQASTAR